MPQPLALAPHTEAALRCDDLLASDGALLVCEPPGAADVAALRQARGGDVEVFLTDFAAARNVDPTPTVSPWLETGTFDRVLCYLPQGKARLEMTLSMLVERLAPDGALYVVGHKREGIGSCARRLAGWFEAVERVLSARHCALLRARRPAPAADAPRRLDDWWRRWTLPEPALEVSSLPGVFSHGRLDEGTRRLLPVLAAQLERGGRALDLGCGAGVIGASLAARLPRARVTLVDASALAVCAARQTLARNGLTGRARATLSDVYSALEGARFDHIITNPPFHQGVTTDDAVTVAMIEGAPAHLERGGTLWMVVNRFRAYTRALEARFSRVEIPFEDTKFRVYRATR